MLENFQEKQRRKRKETIVRKTDHLKSRKKAEKHSKNSNSFVNLTRFKARKDLIEKQSSKEESSTKLKNRSGLVKAEVDSVQKFVSENAVQYSQLYWYNSTKLYCQ